MSLTGKTIVSTLKGNMLFVYYPLKVNSSSVMPVWMLLLAGVLIIIILGVSRLIGGKIKIRKYNTWDCGYEKLTPRMQYTATGFSKPVRIVFRMFYRPGRELTVKEGASPYYPENIKYDVSTERIFEKYFYFPLIELLKRISRRTKYAVQTGSIHMYLVYIFASVLVLMLYNGLFR
jgi:preprotein translocase subunit SecY